MNKHKIVLILGISLVLTMLLFAVYGSTQPRLEIAPSNIKLGKITKGNKVKALLKIINHSSTPVTIDKIMTSCGCVTSISTDHERVLYPGVPFEVPIEFDTKSMSGEIREKVMIVCSDFKSDPYLVNIHGFVYDKTGIFNVSQIVFDKSIFGKEDTSVVYLIPQEGVQCDITSVNVSSELFAATFDNERKKVCVTKLSSSPKGEQHATLFVEYTFAGKLIKTELPIVLYNGEPYEIYPKKIYLGNVKASIYITREIDLYASKEIIDTLLGVLNSEQIITIDKISDTQLKITLKFLSHKEKGLFTDTLILKDNHQKSINIKIPYFGVVS